MVDLADPMTPMMTNCDIAMTMLMMRMITSVDT